MPQDPLHMSGTFTAKFADAQRWAIASAYASPNVSSREVSRRAKAGELLDPDGNLLPAFEIAESTVRTVARRFARDGLRGGEAARINAERLLRRLLAICDVELSAAESDQRNGTPPSAERLRSIAKIIGDSAALAQRLDDRSSSMDAPTPKKTPLAEAALRAAVEGHRNHVPGPTVQLEPVADLAEPSVSELAPETSFRSKLSHGPNFPTRDELRAELLAVAQLHPPLATDRADDEFRRELRT